MTHIQIKWTTSKFFKFCAVNNTVKKVKIQVIEQKKIFVNYVTFTYNIKNNTPTTKIKRQPNLKQTKNLNRHLSKDDIRRDNNIFHNVKYAQYLSSGKSK